MYTFLITTLLSHFVLVPCGFMGVLYLEEEEKINKPTKYLLLLLVCLLPTIVSYCTLGYCAEFKSIAVVDMIMIYLGLLGLLIVYLFKWFNK